MTNKPVADIRKLFGTDKKKENDGVWHELGNGVRVLVARANTRRHQDALEHLSKPFRGQLQRGTLSREQVEQLGIEALAEGVLLGWEGVELDGQPLEYSKENALRLLIEFKDFRDVIAQLSVDVELFREQA